MKSRQILLNIHKRTYPNKVIPADWIYESPTRHLQKPVTFSSDRRYGISTIHLLETVVTSGRYIHFQIRNFPCLFTALFDWSLSSAL